MKRTLPIAALCSVMGLHLIANGVGRAADPATEALNRMVDEEVVAAGIKDPRVIAAMRGTPRPEFVPRDQRHLALYDMAVTLGHGQAISPPFVVAYMTEQLAPQPTDKVLEIGTGSGYQAAVLSPLVKDVYTIEIVEPLGRTAAATFKRLGYTNVHPRIGDGYQGWPEEAPFDKIIVTCSPEKVPQKLIDQLRDGGRLIVPVGERFQQTLYLFKKIDGKLQSQPLEQTMFVPMTGEAERRRLVMPDGSNPILTNGSFELFSPDTGLTEGWYYLRHAEIHADPTAPGGKQVITFANDVPGRNARAWQALAIDGREVSKLDVSLWVRTKKVRQGPTAEQTPRLSITFFREDRTPINQASVGGWTGTFSWRQEKGTVTVPPNARMAIIGLGLLGATGEVSIDDVTLKSVAAGAPAAPATATPASRRPVK